MSVGIYLCFKRLANNLFNSLSPLPVTPTNYSGTVKRSDESKPRIWCQIPVYKVVTSTRSVICKQNKCDFNLWFCVMCEENEPFFLKNMKESEDDICTEPALYRFVCLQMVGGYA